VVMVECDEILQLGRGKGGEEFARNCEDWRLGAKLTGEWRTVAALGQNSSEGGAFGGWRQWSGWGKQLGEVWCSRGGPERSG
jgi:hypothetical protein